MNWFFIALGAPFLWAIANIADDYLVTNYSSREIKLSSGALVLFSSLIGIFFAFIILIFTKGIFSISLRNIILLLVTGGLTVTWMLMYLYSLEIEDISTVVPWFMISPIFGYILGYIFLGEILTKNQMIGSIIILLGALIISLNFEKGKEMIKKKMILYMIFASLAIAISGIIFKYVTVESNFWISNFWEYFGLGIFGLIIYIFVPNYRKQFHFINKIGGKKIFAVNTFVELISIAGNLLSNFALLLAPVSMVYLVSSFQPAIVLILSVLGTKFMPHIIDENISKKILIPKIIAIFMMIAGSIFLFT